MCGLCSSVLNDVMLGDVKLLKLMMFVCGWFVLMRFSVFVMVLVCYIF